MGGEPALEELDATLHEVAGRRGRILSAQKLKTGVYRIAIAKARQRLEVVAKRLTPPLAHRNQLALEQWLPAAGMEHAAPRLLGVAAERAGRVVWHLYEDLGSCSLVSFTSTRPEVEAAIRLIAELHLRFASESVLWECRIWGEGHGMAFYEDKVRDAVAAVRVALSASAAHRPHSGAVRTLLEKLERLHDERDERARMLAEFGGPETLLHGDLWLANIAILPDLKGNCGGRASRIRLIDWDHVGPGSFSYDLSTLILRFPADERSRIVALYRAAAAANGIEVPSDDELQLLFTTAEFARIASDTTWRALLFAREGSQSAFEQLAEINKWFDRFEARSSLV